MYVKKTLYAAEALLSQGFSSKRMPLKPVDSNLLYKSNNVHIYQTSTLGEKQYFRPATYAVVRLA